jgi:hypothetical protein
MTQSDILTQVALFNNLVKQKPWLDIDLVECSPRSVILDCGIDLSVGPDLVVKFDTVFFASLLMTWKTDTTSPVLQVLTGEDEVRVNQQYRVERGYYLFAFQPEDLAEGVCCIIAAQQFSWQVLTHP